MTLGRITGFRLVTIDPERLGRFYTALGFAVGAVHAIPAEEMMLLGLGGSGTRRSMRIGAMRVDLDRYDVPGRPYPAQADAASSLFQHLALVTDDVASAWARAVKVGAVPIGRDGPVTLPASAGGVTAVKFRDPDGHPLELIAFPDAAARGWTGAGVLGIDHSAIVVADVEVATAFYAAHGLTRGTATLNHGPAQAMLDGLDGPRVDVVPLSPVQATPHVELLHYRLPAGAPWGPVAPNDVAATRIVWAGNAPALLRDPDGHLHEVAVPTLEG